MVYESYNWKHYEFVCPCESRVKIMKTSQL